MNREIKFRGKRIDNNEWIYGYLVEYTYKDTIYANGTSPKTNYIYPMKKRSELDCLEYYLKVVPETIGQYTGLMDKYGVDVYEGDIIDIHQTVNGYNQFVIQYDNYKFSARYYNQKTKQILGWYQYDLDELFEINEAEKEIEVIGNIYENEVD